MSRLIIISIILLGIISTGIGSLIYLNQAKHEVDILLSDFIYACENENNKIMQEKANRLSALWSAKQSVLKMFINRTALDNLEAMIVDMDSLTKTKSFDSAYAQANRIKYQLDHIYQKEKPSLDNLI